MRSSLDRLAGASRKYVGMRLLSEQIPAPRAVRMGTRHLFSVNSRAESGTIQSHKRISSLRTTSLVSRAGRMPTRRYRSLRTFPSIRLARACPLRSSIEHGAIWLTPRGCTSGGPRKNKKRNTAFGFTRSVAVRAHRLRGRDSVWRPCAAELARN